MLVSKQLHIHYFLLKRKKAGLGGINEAEHYFRVVQSRTNDSHVYTPAHALNEIKHTHQAVPQKAPDRRSRRQRIANRGGGDGHRDGHRQALVARRHHHPPTPTPPPTFPVSPVVDKPFVFPQELRRRCAYLRRPRRARDRRRGRRRGLLVRRREQQKQQEQPAPEPDDEEPPVG